MTQALRLRSAVLFFFMTMVMVAMATPAAGGDSKAVLVFHSLGYDAPGRFPFDTAFARAMREAAGAKADLYIETLDPNRFSGERLARRTREYLRERYADKKIAVVAVVYDEALAFLLDERDPLFPTVPIAAVLLKRPPSLPERVSVFLVGDFFGATITVALKLNPRARQVAVIDGAPPGAGGRNAVNDEIRQQIKTLGLRVPVVFLHNLPLDQLLSRVQSLPPDGIIFLARQYIGRRGEPIDSINAVSEVARVAPAPLYVSTDTMVGGGGLGGVVISLEKMATALAAMALRVSEKASPLPPTPSVLVPIFDWRQLRRWGIDERLLPPGTELRFREPGLWDQYRWYVVGAVSVALVQSLLIAGLLMQRARRRRMELALRESEARMSLAVDAADLGLWIRDLARHEIWAGDSWRTMFGFGPSEHLEFEDVLQRVHPDDRHALQQAHEMAVAGSNGGRYQMEFRLLLPDGATRWISSQGRVEVDATGQPALIRGAARDDHRAQTGGTGNAAPAGGDRARGACVDDGPARLVAGP